ncbi:MAG: helix-turn-helix transcriptional regulator [Candidatus Izemoplasmatales bacterium]
MKDLLSIRKEKNLTQRELGEIIGVSNAQIGRIESGVCELSLTQYAKLITALSLSAEQASQLMEEALATAKPPRTRKSKARD